MNLIDRILTIIGLGILFFAFGVVSVLYLSTDKRGMARWEATYKTIDRLPTR